jgi:hypothetical protein
MTGPLSRRELLKLMGSGTGIARPGGVLGDQKLLAADSPLGAKAPHSVPARRG